MKELTKFQINCETALEVALKSRGNQIVDRRNMGQSETYITGLLSDTQNKIFNYEDEASILGPKVDIRFEAADYDSPEYLQKDFIEKVITLLDTERTSDK